jgi:hypothetical protein
MDTINLMISTTFSAVRKSRKSGAGSQRAHLELDPRRVSGLAMGVGGRRPHSGGELLAADLGAVLTVLAIVADLPMILLTLLSWSS